jgi:hypothetical protein
MCEEDRESQSTDVSTQPEPLSAKTENWRWRWFFESKFAVALVTVVIGGLFGQCITAGIQSSLKEREFQQVWLKARGDQALQAHKEYLDKEQETVLNAFDLIGSCLTAARDLIDLTDPDFALEGFAGKQREQVAEQRTEMLANYDAVIQKWDSQSHKTGLLMGYYHHGHPEVETAWQDTEKKINSYFDCARDWYKKYEQTPIDTSGTCKKEKDEVVAQLTVMISKLEAERQYSWEGWELPENLRKTLEKR